MYSLIDLIRKKRKQLFINLLLTATIVIVNIPYGLLNKPTDAKIIITGLDNLIPFNKYFIVPYVYWYVYIGFVLLYYAFKNKTDYLNIIMSINLAMLISYVFYFFFPTHVPRPELYGNDIFIRMIKWIYSHDNPYNCLPSLHVLETMIIAIYLNRDKSIKKSFKIFSHISSVLIILSTLFIKQHYVYDGILSILLSYPTLWVSIKTVQLLYRKKEISYEIVTGQETKVV